ncbi:hypothetical protein [Hymenobacter jejuensis]|uniref:Uncharacterized protein n=1 Tax=Hymenobacter jejuensis TaxID=2502781 RepID=A0A5B7ZY17_9BACT|nr:hypothetical protein [Hymenobacter jejuensis]QDA59908.1 hypothetical protein FHG12_07205 [Hymenobacter jejuensis]
MLNYPILEIAISLIFIYLVFSQITLSINELWAGYFNYRGNYLHSHLVQSIGPIYTDGLYSDPTISQLMLRPKRWPPYVSQRLFAQAIINWVSEKAPAPPAGSPPLARFAAGLATAPGGAGSRFDALLQKLLASAQGAVLPAEQLQANLEDWYKEYCLRLTGWYKRDNRIWLLITGLAVAIIGDVDTIRLTKFIARDTAVRNTLVTLGESRAAEPRPAETPGVGLPPAQAGSGAQPPPEFTVTARQSVDTLRKELLAMQKIGLPMGFGQAFDRKAEAKLTNLPEDLKRRDANGDYKNTSVIIWMLFGWLLTGLAMMVGAPFWFDVLNRFVNIRNLGPKPDTPNEER